ncbi:cysteine-rich CWC protein [Sinobacterium caligoides]|uniref:Cysteine-rich CWC protein n=1 Tax=Sinobacterium caligoides TaxID=933926 RepID=A0A3N2E0R8_9GAMM|nr:cysteine-rich CWC family protein [Sinobacterium caligoides]ROS05627.1 cysteine-rich CWC protein [Sinobacterium caligoides]
MHDKAHSCPLCGGDNRCGADSNSQATPCWCMHNKVDQQRLQRAHPQLADQQCLCQHCLAPFLFSQPSTAADDDLGTDIMAPHKASDDKEKQ